MAKEQQRILEARNAYEEIEEPARRRFVAAKRRALGDYKRTEAQFREQYEAEQKRAWEAFRKARKGDAG